MTSIMKNKKSNLGVILLGLTLCTGVLAESTNALHSSVVYADTVDDVLSSIKRTDLDLTNLQVTLGKLNDQIITHTLEIETTANNLTNTQNNLLAKQEEIANTQLAIEQNQKEVAARYETVGNQVRVLQLSGVDNYAYLDFLFESENASDFISRIKTISKIVGLNAKAIKSLAEEEKALELQQTLLKRQESDLISIQNSIKETQKSQEIKTQVLAEEKVLFDRQLTVAKEKSTYLNEALVTALNTESLSLTSFNYYASTILVTDSDVATLAKTINLSNIQIKLLTSFRSKLGVPYVWGGESMAEGGYDCSGLMQAVYAEIGITLPRVSQDQQNVGQTVDKNNPAVGDLIFFGTPAYHVGVYAGNNMYIQAPQPGDVVKYSVYNANAVTNVKRILPESQIGDK